MDPVPLDPSLVSRFKDKTMAIVGYETDQVVSIYIVSNDYGYIYYDVNMIATNALLFNSDF